MELFIQLFHLFLLRAVNFPVNMLRVTQAWLLYDLFQPKVELTIN